MQAVDPGGSYDADHAPLTGGKPSPAWESSSDIVPLVQCEARVLDVDAWVIVTKDNSDCFP